MKHNDLKVNDRVCWNGDPNDCGTIVEAPKGAVGVRIAWDNGKEGWIDRRDIGDAISKVTQQKGGRR